MLLGDRGHRLPVRGGGGVDERLVGGGAAGQGRVDRRRVRAHEHERQAGGGRAGRGHGRGVRGRVAARMLDGEAVEAQRHADPLHLVAAARAATSASAGSSLLTCATRPGWW